MIIIMIKKLTYMLILLLSIANIAFAKPKNAHIEYDTNPLGSIYSDYSKVLNTANANIFLYEKAYELSEKKMHLEQALRFYYLATKIDNGMIDANIGMGRVYDAMKLDRQAKEFFYKALNINPADARANLYFANFFYQRNDNINALKYYIVAYKNGLANSFELNYRMGVIYEKLADLVTAKAFYSQALKISPKNSEVSEKIRLLDELNYADSQYYLYGKNIIK